MSRWWRSVRAVLTRRSLLLAAAVGVSVPTPPRRQPRTVTARPEPTALPPALFVVCHPDDETLTMGVPIAEHAQLGQDVHVLLLTRGQASGVRGRLNGTTARPSRWWGVMHDPAREGYEPLTLDEFGAARVREAVNALGCLGPVTIHEADLTDGEVSQADAEDAILAVADTIAPGGAVRLKTHTHTVDQHPDHLAAGAAARALAERHPGRFGDTRYHVLPSFWDDPRAAELRARWDTPYDDEIAARVVNACRAHGAWSPPHTFAIGHHSSPDLWPPLMDQPRSLHHN